MKLKLLVLITLIIASLLVQPKLSEADVSNEDAFTAAINAQRDLKGLSRLQPDLELSLVAKNWSAFLASQKTLLHSDLPVGITQNWKKLGENVGMGTSVESISTAFIGSSTHYKNIIDPEFTHVGIGITIADGTIYVVQRFMALEESLVAKPLPVIPTSTLPPATPTPTVVVIPILPIVEPTAPTAPEAQTPKVVSDINRGSIKKWLYILFSKWIIIWKRIAS